MENSVYIGLSKQVVLRENMDIIAQNVANVNTPGYRAQNMVFTEFIEDPRYMKEDMAFVLDYGQYQMTDPGSLKDTGGSLDIALVGNGFLGIQTPSGIQYTRAGNLTMDAEGVLRNARGMAVADTGGNDIVIPADAKEIRIDKKGIISTDQGQIGQLMISEFKDYQKLNPKGNGLYETTEAGIPAEKTTVLQGKLEGSNVQAVVEMTRMIDVLREYQAVQNMMQSEHERLRSSAQRLAKTQA
ncbi:MAG TPA: flagellar basal-body rod protein FlgF [Alphaproteobacteria bacterium]|nr:flagellar basal-body rod protein FlgF [Alphaproteobacteria bacterium]